MPARRYSKYFPFLFLVADLICLNFGFWAANDLRFNQFIYPNDAYTSLQLVLNGIWILVFFSAGLQIIDREQRLVDHLNKVLTALVINLAIVFALWFATKPYYYSRQHLFYTYLVFSSSLVVWRSIWHYFIRYFRLKGFNFRNVVIVGSGELADEMVTFMRENKAIGYNFIGLFSDDKNVKATGKLNELEAYCETNSVDIIFCVLNKVREERVYEIIDFAESNLMKVKILSHFSKFAGQNLSIQNYGTIPVLNVNEIPLDNKLNQSIKRAFDIIFASLTLVFILSWLIPLIALFIRLESKGPVFFKQLRHGLGNKPFLCWKFRTMVVNNDADSKQATKGDSRITRIGSILRRTSIDELPQFINVLIGDMSVVGPRPHPILLNEKFQPSIEKFWQRHAVKPGITGLAQARGFRGETSELSDMVNRVKLDRFYVKNWSLVLDFKIILLTIVSILRGSENAY